MKGELVLELASCVHGASFPIGVNAKCFLTSPTLISFPVALWPLQLWSDEVEKVSTQLNYLCSKLLGVMLVFRGGGAVDSFPACRQGRISGVFLPSAPSWSCSHMVQCSSDLGRACPVGWWLYPV